VLVPSPYVCMCVCVCVYVCVYVGTYLLKAQLVHGGAQDKSRVVGIGGDGRGRPTSLELCVCVCVCVCVKRCVCVCVWFVWERGGGRETWRVCEYLWK
jgi:hypothetical protein